MGQLEELQREVIACTRCPRLVEYRQRVAQQKRRMYRDWDYWGRPLPSFGDPSARVLVVGLAPAAHGGNRTGRMFTGDGSGDWLYETLFKFGFSSSPSSLHRDDGLTLTDLYVTATLRCVPPENKPLPVELASCRPYLLRELELLQNARVVVALGRIAFETLLVAYRQLEVELPSPKAAFAHGTVSRLPNGVWLVASYHPSRQNTQTGRLTRSMFEEVFAEVQGLLALGS